MLSEDARGQMRLTLKGMKGIEREHIDDVISHIQASLVNASILEESGNPKGTKSEIKALHKAIERLLPTIRNLSVESKLALNDCLNKLDNEQKHSDFFPASLPRNRTETLDLQIYAEIMEKAAAGALSNINVKLGASINFKARAIAIHIRESLEEFGIDITTTDDRPFMAILNVALSDLLPTKKDASYHRHGRWAKSVENISEVNWASMTVDNKELGT